MLSVSIGGFKLFFVFISHGDQVNGEAQSLQITHDAEFSLLIVLSRQRKSWAFSVHDSLQRWPTGFFKLSSHSMAAEG